MNNNEEDERLIENEIDSAQTQENPSKNEENKQDSGDWSLGNKNVSDIMNAIKNKIDSYKQSKNHSREEKKQIKIALHLYEFLDKKISEEPGKAQNKLKPKYFRSEDPMFFFKTGVDEKKVFDVVAVFCGKDGNISLDRFNASDAALYRMSKGITSHPQKVESRDERDGL